MPGCPGICYGAWCPCLTIKNVGAVQVRKAIVNRAKNLWTRGQQAEMALDSYFQQQRIAVGGIGELRGNGQFVRRQALEQCGGWNEETITDDLDLTMRIHFSGWDIHLLLHPPVGEEGVERPLALWHQRNRWAEGGYQRYLDYWRLIAKKASLFRLKPLICSRFWLIQYGLPTVAFPDFMMAFSAGPCACVFAGFGPGLYALVHLACFGAFAAPGSRAFWSLVCRPSGEIFICCTGCWLSPPLPCGSRCALKRLRWVKTTHVRRRRRVPDRPILTAHPSNILANPIARSRDRAGRNSVVHTPQRSILVFAQPGRR